MTTVIKRESLVESVKAINKWHQNTPLLLVFSRQRPGPEGKVAGNVESVRAVYDALFNLEQIGVQDDARKYYLHFCHGSGAKDYPFAIKKPTENYGKTHQRIIKDTFANASGFLNRIAEGRYVVKENAAQLILNYLGASGPIDLRPLVLIHYWKATAGASTIGDLWKRFTSTFAVDEAPFDKIFTCSGLADLIPLAQDGEQVDMRLICLPDEYGTGACDAEFWNRFRSILEDKFSEMRWQGRVGPLAAGIASALMHDQSVFLLGAPGTGKTSIVTGAILPALRAAYGTENELRFSEFPLTPASSSADIFGFQGLDGDWVGGPFVREVMLPYAPESLNGGDAETLEQSGIQPTSEGASPHLLFFDEANRVDIEALLSPIQAALDRMQARKPGGVVTLGRDQYILPNRLWRIFAGNSPATDIGRKEQSRPFKRRLSVVLPPDPMEEIVTSSTKFRAACLELLQRAASVPDVEVSEPALALLGDLTTNTARLEDLRIVLETIRALPQVAVTVGLLESILLRSASHKALKQDSPLDAALTQSLVGLLSGDASLVERVAEIATDRGFAQLALTIRRDVVSVQQGDGHFEIDPLL